MDNACLFSLVSANTATDAQYKAYMDYLVPMLHFGTFFPLDVDQTAAEHSVADFIIYSNYGVSATIPQDATASVAAGARDITQIAVHRQSWRDVTLLNCRKPYAQIGDLVYFLVHEDNYDDGSLDSIDVVWSVGLSFDRTPAGVKEFLGFGYSKITEKPEGTTPVRLDGDGAASVLRYFVWDSKAAK